MPKEYKKLIQRYEAEHNFMFLVCGGKHYKIRHKPTGKLVVFSVSPSDVRAIQNFERDMKRVIRGAI